MTHAMSGRDHHSFVLQTLSPVQVTGVPPSDHPVPEYRPAPADQQGNPSPAGRNDGAGAGPRVLLVAPQPFFALRGTPMNVKQMATVLGEAGYRVHLATFAMGEPVEIPGVHHHRAMPIPGAEDVPIGFSGSKLVNDAALALLVTRLLLTYRFALAHAVEESVFFTLPLARIRRVPVIFDLDSSISEQLEYSGSIRNQRVLRTVRALEKAALRRSSLALTVCLSLTEKVRELAPATPIAQIEDCPQPGAARPPDLVRVDALRAEWNPERRPLAVYTGNFAPYQGLDLLFGSLKYTREVCPDFRLLVVGGSDEEIARTRTALALDGVADLVVFTGRQPPEDMADYLALGDTLVSPRSEGTNTPLKLYDYMAAGKPIVATALPTHTQVLDDTTAILVEPNPESYGRALGRALGDVRSYHDLGVAAQDRVNREYSREAFARKLLEAYRRLLAG